MIDPVERKIGEINLKKKKALRKQRDQDLLRWGFDGKKKSKNDIPLILTDEEYEAVREADREYSAAVKTDKNPVANLMIGFAIAAVVIGVVAGVVFFEVASDIGFVYLTVSIVLGVFMGAIFYGIAEAIRLLQQIVDKD